MTPIEVQRAAAWLEERERCAATAPPPLTEEDVLRLLREATPGAVELERKLRGMFGLAALTPEQLMLRLR